MGLDAFKDDSGVEEGSTLSTRLTCESGEVKVADVESHDEIVIPELSPDDELPDDRVNIKVTKKISPWKYEAEIADDVRSQNTEGGRDDTAGRVEIMNNGPGDPDVMKDILNKR
jgi:hypothetical protein